MALVAEVAGVLVRHGYPHTVGAAPVAQTAGLYRTAHPNDGC